MVYRHSCTFISRVKPRELSELPHFIFLLSLKLHDSKLMLKRVPTSLLTGCDTIVALDSGLPRSVKSKADHSR